MLIRCAEEKDFRELRQFYDRMCEVLGEKDFLPEHIVFRYLSVMTAMISSIIYARMLRTERSSRGCVTLSIKHGSV